MGPRVHGRPLASFAMAVTPPSSKQTMRATATSPVSRTEQDRALSARPAHALLALADANSRFTTINGLTVHHKEWTPHDENSTGGSLVCIHGFGASLFSFEAAAPVLVDFGWSVAAFDVPGFGLTERPGVGHLIRYSPPYVGRIAVELPLTRQGSRMVLGHSMGGLVAVEAALAESEAVQALVLIAPAVTSSAGGRIARSAGMLFSPLFLIFSLALAPVLTFVLRTFVQPRCFWENGLALAWTGADPVPANTVDGYRRPIGVPGWERGLLNFVRSMLMYRATQSGRSVQALASIARQIPVLVVHGADDNVIPVANSRALKAAIPELELHVMQDVGHVLHEEKPEEFASIVNDFFVANEQIGAPQNGFI